MDEDGEHYGYHLCNITPRQGMDGTEAIDHQQGEYRGWQHLA